MTMDNTDDAVRREAGGADFSARASTVDSALGDKPDDAALGLRDAVVQKLVRATLSKGAFNAEMLLSELADVQVQPDHVVDRHIPEAARRLGEMWTEDDIGFAEVTIATARLQGLLTLLAPPLSTGAGEEDDPSTVLLILQPGDAHTLGPHVATAQMRRMGVSVRLLFGPKPATVLRILENESYDLVLFSCSRPSSLASIAQMVKTIRTSFDAVPPMALGGLVLDLADRVKARTGVDLVTGEVRVAVKLCNRKWAEARSVMR